MARRTRDEIQAAILRALSESMTGRIQLRVPINNATGKWYLLILAEKGRILKIEKETQRNIESLEKVNIG